MSDADRTSRPRIAILGGGAAGITAAFELSSAGWRERYESITVYQQGWRLGGKGASGRGECDRIEEHGLHIWLGFYQNAFRMMRECYDELGRDPSVPIATVEQAFERASQFVVQEPRGDGWLPWTATFPETDELPGTGEPTIPPLWVLLVRALRLAMSFNDAARRAPEDPSQPAAISLQPATSAAPGPVSLAPTSRPETRRVISAARAEYRKLWYLVSSVKQAALAGALELAESLPLDASNHEPRHHTALVELLDRALRELHELHEHPDDVSDQARREWYLTDVALAAVRGTLADGVLQHPDGLDAIDGEDFVAWLVRHGASGESARCGMVTTLMYDLPFAYRDGDPATPSIGAGTALRGAIRTLFTYSGAIAWRMRAGMGDIVFAPLFEVLERRGVRFEFFHRVDALHLDDDRRQIASIDVSRQVELLDPTAGYRPLVDVGGLPCWPNAPLTAQLREPVTAADVESFWSTREPVEQLVLRDGVDYDVVVLALPVGAHPYLCAELIDADARWRAMVDEVGTIYTQACQLWLNADAEALGCEGPPTITGGYLEPFDTCADMSHLIERETWRAGEVGAIAYLCNAMPTPATLPSRDDRDLPARAAAQVQANALTFLRDAAGPLWPGGIRRYPTEFRWELLIDRQERVGAARFDAQFWRANVDPSERYVLSLPGSSQHRLAPGDSGFANLVLAGDWTRCGLNSGCVEAAVTSGLLAAVAVGGDRPSCPIIGCRDEGGRSVW